MTQSVAGDRLFRRVVDEVLEVIASSGLKPGDALPTERDLAQTLGVSRNVLREGFRVLEEWGLVHSRPGSGRYLRHLPADIARAVERADTRAELEVASIADVLESRALLEERIVTLACQRRTLHEARRITAVAERLDGWQDNVDFHLAIAAATHNFMLERTLRDHMELLAELRQRDHYDTPDRARTLLGEHRALAAAISGRDEIEARRLLEGHLHHTRHSVGVDAGVDRPPPPVDDIGQALTAGIPGGRR